MELMESSPDAQTCGDCGHLMVRNGSGGARLSLSLLFLLVLSLFFSLSLVHGGCHAQTDFAPVLLLINAGTDAETQAKKKKKREKINSFSAS